MHLQLFMCLIVKVASSFKRSTVSRLIILRVLLYAYEISNSLKFLLIDNINQS